MQVQSVKRSRVLVRTLLIGLVWCWMHTPSGVEATRQPAAARQDKPDVIVITIDTLRADRLGVYGFDGVQTPNLDGLARRGVTFTRAVSPTPLTMPSHTSIFTGTYPPYHGVRDNGGFVVPQQIETMAEIYRANGYQTAAFVAAFVLDSRWGLDQGFETYFDSFQPPDRSASLESVQRPANEVVDRSLRWLDDRRPGQPVFLWVHLYDPHFPYAPPEPFRTEYLGRPYLGEIAFVDSQIGRLLGTIDDTGLAEAVIVVAGDHGESLNEHGEHEHGLFVYEATLHVPLIFSGRLSGSAGTRRSEVVSLVDILPTLLELSGLPIPAAVQGRSLAPLFDPAAAAQPRTVYAESYFPRLRYGWSELRSIQNDRYKLIASVDPELFDLADDPDEQHNLVGRLNSVFLEMSNAAAAMFAQLEGNVSAEQTVVDEQTRRQLAALGYLSATAALVDEDNAEVPSPREKIAVHNRLLDVFSLFQAAEYEKAEGLLLELLASDDEAIVHRTLAGVYVETGDEDRAIQHLHKALQIYERLPEAHFMLGQLFARRGDHAEAAGEYLLELEMAPTHALANLRLAEAYGNLGDPRLEEQSLRRALELNADLAQAGLHLARIHLEKGEQYEEAVDIAERALSGELSVRDRALGLFLLADLHNRLGNEALSATYAGRARQILDRPQQQGEG